MPVQKKIGGGGSSHPCGRTSGAATNALPPLLTKFPIEVKVDDPPVTLVFRRLLREEKLRALDLYGQKDVEGPESDERDNAWIAMLRGLLLEVRNGDGKAIEGGIEQIENTSLWWENLGSIMLEVVFRREAAIAKAMAGSRGPGARPEPQAGGGEAVQGLPNDLPGEDVARLERKPRKKRSRVPVVREEGPHTPGD